MNDASIEKKGQNRAGSKAVACLGRWWSAKSALTLQVFVNFHWNCVLAEERAVDYNSAAADLAVAAVGNNG